MAARALGRCATIVRMDRGLRYKITVGAIVGVVLACGAVAAVAATGPGSGHRNAHRRQAAHQRVRDHGGTLAVASTYLGVSKTELRKDLREGKTLAQVAKETSGKSEAGLIEAIVAARKERLAAAVTAGVFSQAQASTREAMLGKRITDLVNRRFSAAGAS